MPIRPDGGGADERPATDEPRPAEHLRSLREPGRWARTLGMAGLLLLAAALVLTFTANSALWFLAYPILILGAAAALSAAVVLLLRPL